MKPIRTTAFALIACSALASAQSSGPTQRGLLADVKNAEELREHDLLPKDWQFDVHGGLTADGRLAAHVIALTGPANGRILLQRYEGRVRVRPDGSVYASQAEPVERALLHNPRTRFSETLSNREGDTFHCQGWAVETRRGGEVGYALLVDAIKATFEGEAVWIVGRQGSRVRLRKNGQVRTADARDVELLQFLGVPHELMNRTATQAGVAKALTNLDAAKRKQTEAACANRLRQIALAALIYGDDKRTLPAIEGDDGTQAIELLAQLDYLDASHGTRCPCGAQFKGFQVAYTARTLSSRAPVAWCDAHTDEEGQPFVLVALGDAATARMTAAELQQALARHAR